MKKDRLAQLNEAIVAGKVKTLDGVPLEAPLEEALVTDDGKRLYPVNDGIPVLLEGESVALDQLRSA